MTVKLLMLVIFFAIMLGVGFYSRRHATNVNDFVLGGRGVGPWLTAFAYGTSYFSAVVFIGYAGQFGWKYGLASTWIGIGNALIGSLLAWVVLGRRTRVMSKHLSSATMPEFFAEDARECESQIKGTNTGINDWVSFTKLFFVIASRSILFSVLSIFIPILYITVINGEAGASSLALTMYFAMGAVLTYMGGALSDKLGFLKTVRLGNIIFLPSVLVFIFVPNAWGFFGAMIPMAFGVFSQYGPITVLGQKYLAKNAGFASGITLGLGITLGGLVAPYIGHLADIYDVQTALMTLIPVGALGLLMSFWLKEPK